MIYHYEEEDDDNDYNDDKDDELHQLVMQCVQYSNNLYQGTIEDQQKASGFFYDWIQHPKAFIICLEILEHFDDLYSNYTALNVINSLVTYNWINIDPHSREKLKDILYQILQSDRNSLINDMCSKLISRVAIHEFPEYWEDFLIDSLTRGNSLVLIYYLENLEDNPNISQNKKILIHKIFISYFDLIKDAIFSQDDITPQSLYLYSLISQWAPLERIVNEKIIHLLTTHLIENNLTRDNAIKCLDVIFIQRCDSKNEFPRIHNLLLTNLFSASKMYADVAVLMANILTAHLDFFGKDNGIIKTVKTKVEPKTSEINENGEEILVFNISLPQYNTNYYNIYPFYDTFHDCFLILSSPGWCLNKTGSSNDRLSGNFDDSENRSYFDYDETNNDQSNSDDDKSRYGSDLYWSTWCQFLSFADNLNCEKEKNYIIKIIPQLFFEMTSIIMTVVEYRMIVNSDARKCFSIMIKNEPQFVISQLESQNLSLNFLYTVCCCIENMNINYANQFITKFLVPNQDPSMVIYIIQCIAFFLRFLPSNALLIQYFIDMFIFSMDFQPPNLPLQLSATSALMYLSTYSSQDFYFDDYKLLNILDALISKIEPGPSLFDPTNQSLFIIAARVINGVKDNEVSSNYIKSVFQSINSFIYSKCPTILDDQIDSNTFLTFNLCINLINDFSRRCYQFAQIGGESLLSMCLSIIDSKSSKDRDLELIYSCYELSCSIICYCIDWNTAEPLTKKILETPLSGEKSQYGFALKFLTSIHQKFPDSISIFPIIYENIVESLMTELVDNSQFVLDYLLTVKFWNFCFQLPIGFMQCAINEFPLICIKPALVITKEYCINYQIHYIAAYIRNEKEAVFRFLLEILINSMFNIYFHEIVRCFMSFFFAVNHLDFNDISIVYESFLHILYDVFSNSGMSQLIQNQEESSEESVNWKGDERYFVFRKFLETCKDNYMDQQKMELELRNLVVASHCCLLTISNLFTISEIKNPLLSFEMQLDKILKKMKIDEDGDEKDQQVEKMEIESLFNDIKDEDFDS
ncbi:Karyopherin transporter [Tritrichomonas musculus]|uniref:Karyopherin transporter n=1 Tax=Tritrichomonas musculus TaxID=1915356 RepID=A0ABR2KPT6_9EUKA